MDIFEPFDICRINHSAGQVTYDCRDFVARNRDSLDRNLSQAMYECQHSLLKTLFPEGKHAFFKETTKTRRSMNFNSWKQKDISWAESEQWKANLQKSKAQS